MKIYRLWEVEHANFHDRVHQYRQEAFDPPQESMAPSSTLACHSKVTFPWLSFRGKRTCCQVLFFFIMNPLKSKKKKEKGGR